MLLVNKRIALICIIEHMFCAEYYASFYHIVDTFQQAGNVVFILRLPDKKLEPQYGLFHKPEFRKLKSVYLQSPVTITIVQHCQMAFKKPSKYKCMDIYFHCMNSQCDILSKQVQFGSLNQEKYVFNH